MYEVSSKKTFNNIVAEIIEFRELLYFFTWRDIKVRYKQAVLGVLWAVIQPLMFMFIFVFLNSFIGISSGNIPYPLFALSGIIIWNIFAQGVVSAGNIIITNANMIKKVYFPRMILPISAFFAFVFDFFISFVMLIIIILFWRIEFCILNAVIFSILALIISMLFSLGVGLFFSGISAKYRDFRYILPFFVQLLFFTSPIIYSTEFVANNRFGVFYYINPYAGIIDLFRHGLFGSDLNVNGILVSSAAALICLLAGFFVFNKFEKILSDVA